ncbi:sensor domain-containing diguanylate cyclase [Mycobacterium sp. M26]|uniref:sensor domain-containing diguanylate cyclase n=1 Tax=Mycobacterium sp. M26 TaxID=1762962 RepID=UPI00073E97EB|nr:sensor domain-containing diguanylate cyclase [Mycobacterium sp. M26]
MDKPRTPLREVLARASRVAALLVLIIAALGWVGWSTGTVYLTRINPAWPPMTPWTSLSLGTLAVAVLLQSRQGRALVWVGRGLAILVAVFAVAVLAEYVTGRAFGFDQLWFHEALQTVASPWPGRPSLQTATSLCALAVATVSLRMERRWTSALWAVCMSIGLVISAVSLVAYLFDATTLIYDAPMTGIAMSTAVAVLALTVALSTARPDRPPLEWLLSRPDRGALIRLYGLGIGFPILVAVLRGIFLASGRSERAAFALSVLICTAITMVIGFRLRRSEQDLLIRAEQLARERAEAEKRYRILADNAVDVIVHLRGPKVVWVSPSVKPALGYRMNEWIGSEFSSQIHPDDLPDVVAVLSQITDESPVAQRLRVRSADGDYRWVDGHAKPYVDADGKNDGIIAALRIVDDRVKVEQQLEQLARFDTLTGLANRGEALARLEKALEHPPAFGVHLGILFCDVDRFKNINDTWGHGFGDTVLSTLAARIRDCVRPGDTVGRTGGDEILVVLPGLTSVDQLIEISETIRARAAEPIADYGQTIRATLSIGATLAIPGETVSSVLARADAAMYQAKAGDRNTVVLVEPQESSRQA